jgi:biotin transport system substrate-specific component
MAVAVYGEKYRSWRYRAFQWCHELSTAQKIGLALGMACVTGLFAQIRIPLGFTPVPITGQVFAVLLSGVLLGSRYGGLSQVMYIALGAFGVPWFQGWSGGLGYLAQAATVGYLAGFVLAALLIGRLTERYIAARGFLPQLGLMLTGVAVIHLAGALYFSSFMHTGPLATVQMAVVPFIFLDIAKAAAVASIATALLPKTPYNGEVDMAKYQVGTGN